MTYHIIRKRVLPNDYFASEVSGVEILARVSCADGLTVSEAALQQIMPEHGCIGLTLIAHHNNSGSGSAIAGFLGANSVIIKIVVRKGEDSDDVATRYLHLLERWLNALPNDDSAIIAVLNELDEWSRYLTAEAW